MIQRRWLILLLLLLGVATAVNAQQETVVFSSPGGTYSNSFQLKLRCQSPDNHVRYTINGNTPNAMSTRYEEPLTLDATLYSHSDIYTIPTSPEDLFYAPDSVSHVIVIRAAVFDADDICISKTVTNTYLIKELGFRHHELPVVSLCVDSLSLFDEEMGIMVPGVNWVPESPTNTGNYFQTGREWERTAHFEFIEPEQQRSIHQDCGVRTHGNRARLYPSKGLKLYAREEYGEKRFNYSFFEDYGIDSFKRLVLKPYSTLWPFTGVQDHICNRMALNIGLDAPHSRPVMLYLNGEYWGIYYLQERIDEHYLEDHFSVNADLCTMIQNWHTTPEFGDASEYKRLTRWLDSHDTQSQRNYNYICEQVDVEDFINYLIFETFIANWDWPANNTRFWKEKGGRWRWVFYDGDAALTRNDFPVFENASYTGDDTWPSSKKASLLFRKCFENEQFRQQFRERMQELTEGWLSYEATHPILTEASNEIRPEIPHHLHRRGAPASIGDWEWGLSLIDDFLKKRSHTFEQLFDSHVIVIEHELHPDRFVCVPNPTTGSFSISLTDPLSAAKELTIYDIYGRLVWIQQVDLVPSIPNRIDVDLRQGVYLVKIGSHCERLICE